MPARGLWRCRRLRGVPRGDSRHWPPAARRTAQVGWGEVRSGLVRSRPGEPGTGSVEGRRRHYEACLTGSGHRVKTTFEHDRRKTLESERERLMSMYLGATG